MSYKQVLTETDTAVEFMADGENLLILSSHNGGTWTLELIAPDGEAIDLGLTVGDDNFQQRLAMPKDTKLRLSGGTAGAKAWISQIYRDVKSQLV